MFVQRTVPVGKLTDLLNSLNCGIGFVFICTFYSFHFITKNKNRRVRRHSIYIKILSARQNRLTSLCFLAGSKAALNSPVLPFQLEPTSLGFKLAIKQKTRFQWSGLYKNTQRTLYGGDKRDRTADLCGVNAAQPPEADMIKKQEVSGSYIPHKTKNPAPLSRYLYK